MRQVLAWAVDHDPAQAYLRAVAVWRGTGSSRHAPKPGRSRRCPVCAHVEFVMCMSVQSQG
jgi:hypothetical protein